MTTSDQLLSLGITLPDVVRPFAAYVPALRTGDLVLTSGQLPVASGHLIATGVVGREVSPAEATAAARVCALNALAAAAEAAGGVDRIDRIVKIVVYVASDPSFHDQPTVGNGASELLGEIFGEKGQHVRSAVGVAVLPLNAPVEIELTCQVRG